MLALSCKKSALENANETLPRGNILASGFFVRSAHSTSGQAKIVKDANGTVSLVIENFKTDNGPDLRVWLSPNNNASPYQEVGKLKAVTGNFSYPLSSDINFKDNNRVLIWCEDFSILFGYAVLQ